jgi:hypothetical protein
MYNNFKTIIFKFLSLLDLEPVYLFSKNKYFKNTGWLNSFRRQKPVDSHGLPLPWYTYPAIEFIKQLDLSQKLIFEYGSGNSTLFWSSIARKVTSVEGNQEWYQKLNNQIKLLNNAELILKADKESYINEIKNHQKFDIIIIDGYYRQECAKIAMNYLNQGGMIILDNSDWHIEAARILRESDLIQIDMTGLGPINSYCWTTSFFLDRQYSFMPISIHQPEHGVNAIKQYAEISELNHR